MFVRISGILFLLLLNPFISPCQINEKLAESLSEEFPDYRAAQISRVTTFDFLQSDKSIYKKYDQDSFPSFYAMQTNTTEWIGLSGFSSFQDAIFYDETSIVHGVDILNSKGKVTSKVQTICSNYESDGIFHDDVKVCSYTRYISGTGGTLNLRNQKIFKNLQYLTTAYFHGYYPAQNRTIEFRIPEWMELDIMEINFDKFIIEKKESTEEGLKVIRYSMTDVDPFEYPYYSPSRQKIYPHILILPKSAQTPTERVDYFASTDDMYKWYSSLCKNINEDDPEVQAITEELIAGKETDKEKIEAIFYWVQDHVRYIAFEYGIMGFRPDGAQNVFKKKYGDCKGMANLCKTMLKQAGFDARLAWIGTQDIPYTYDIPSLVVDNHMICALLHEGEKYFLDPTEKWVGFGHYAERIQGRPVLIEDGDKYILSEVPVATKEEATLNREIHLKVENGALVGNYKSVYRGEDKTEMLRSYDLVKTDDREVALLEYLTQGNKNVNVTNVKHSPFETRGQNLTIDYDLSLDNYLTDVGSEYYINLDYFQEFDNMEIEEDRKVDIDFREKIFIETDVFLDMPAGFKVQYLPEAVNEKTDDFEFDLSYKVEGAQLVYRKRIYFPKGGITKANFKACEDAIEKLNAFYNDQIVLEKI